MYNLVLKDFMIQKKYSKSLFLNILLIFLVAQFFNVTATYTIVPFMTALSFIMYGYGFGEKNDVDIMLISLPVNRNDIVVSKYVSSIIFLVLGIIITMLLGSVFRFFSFSKINRIMNFQDILFCTFSTILYISIYFPLLFKFGYIRAQAKSGLIMIVILAFQFVAVMAITFINEGTAKKFIMDLANQPNFNSILSAVTVILSCVLLLISITISANIYTNKDF